MADKPKYFPLNINNSWPHPLILAFLDQWKVEYNQAGDKKEHLKLLLKNCKANSNGDTAYGFVLESNNQFYIFTTPIPTKSWSKQVTSENKLGLIALTNRLLDPEKRIKYANIINKATVVIDTNADLQQRVSQLITKGEATGAFKIKMSSESARSDDGSDTKHDLYISDSGDEDQKDGIVVNHLATEPAVKLELPIFNENEESAKSWVSNTIFILELAGVRDTNKQIAKLLSALSGNLQKRVQEAIAQGKTASVPLTIDKFGDYLESVTSKSKNELARLLDELAHKTGETLKELYFRIFNLTKMLFPTADEEMLTRYATESFRKKVPRKVSSSINFMLCNDTGVALVKVAEKILNALENTQVVSNNIYTGGSTGRRYTSSNRGGKTGRTDSKSDFRSQTCFFCGRKGHFLSECRFKSNWDKFCSKK